MMQRTQAGDAELATPAHGLSLTQRRFLTLLDTSCSMSALALRHPSEPMKFERDLDRLVQLGLVALVAPMAAEGPKAPAIIRLGAPALSRRLPYALLAFALLALAWTGWHVLVPPATSGPSKAATHARETNAAEPDAPAVEPQPIAVRVLRGDPGDRNREAAKAPRTEALPARNAQPKAVEPALVKTADAPAVLSPPALPVERRSPPPGDAGVAPGAGASGASSRSSASEPPAGG